MSESPLFLSPHAAASRRAELSASGSVPPPSDEFEPEDPPSTPARPVREGLPTTYRMRAEPHYVEALARPRPEKAALPAPAAAEPRGEARVKPGLDRVFGTASDSVARALGSIQASLADLNGEGRSLRERTLLELARAEAVRAAWLADALAVLQREPLPGLDQVNLGAVVSRVAELLGPEQRITGQGLAVGRAERPITVFGDERLLIVAVGGMVQGLAACVGGPGLARVALRVSPLRDGATRAVEVSQSAVRMPAVMLARLFEAEWPEHPAGATGAVFLAAARRIAALQGGSLEARPVETGGCRLVLTLPAAE